MPRYRHYRRLSVIAATLVVGAGMTAACGGGDGGGGDGASTGTVKLSFWTHTHPPMIDLNKKLIAEYEKSHPNVKIEYQTIPNTEFGTKMLTSLSTGAGPDIINMDDNALRGEYIPKNLLAPVDPAGFGKSSAAEIEGGYVPGTLDGAKDAKGTLYGVPSEFNGTAFAINKKHFKDAGLDPSKPPKTWREVVEYGKALNKAGHKQAFNFLYLHSGWYSQWFQTLANQTGGSILSEDGKTPALQSPGTKAAMNLWVELARTSGIADPKTSSRDATAPYQDLASGTQSMAIVYPWAMEQIQQSNPDTYADLAVVPLPQADPAKPVSRVYGYFWAVNNASKQKTEAWKFISYLASQHDRWLSDVSFVQPVTDWQSSEPAKKTPFIDVIAAAYAQGRYDQVGPHWNEVQDVIRKAVDEAVFDGRPVDDVLKEADESVRRSIG
ncbi:ABC transporter substrate-binding protein [Sphaerisporangium krabiense]|uniref:ABC-type glycerol-3-phosphate transport system substrate-binding protein n=1 Tax=Sphaerisporangium krabiense TaxID=763782 RepID=A0A7W9DP90_9ACTN|nr:ABC transporter substrate-binding protein [Sphaerisporangium krabiense]MBB5626182.1 ABC-type glycerol-3-phosphate transport system substrate-binding protein [Sphaerisporangium krabiense]GII66151.1 ABC transporter substrate-binding protein [Sphaerisporangium krabiense]